MTSERWQQIDRLFHSALELESRERAAFLVQACNSDESLRQEVASLIRSHEQSESFIEAPANDVAAELIAGLEARLQAGEAVGHYQIVSLLGKGGMGEVYLAQDTILGRQVALKRLPAEFTLDAEQVSRFEQEARAASALNHPNIVTIHEIGHTTSLHFLTTEFIDGETLRQHQATARMTIDEVLNIATQVASALGAAHAAGIVHRDIKPENIMIRPDGYVKVLDFGIAKLVEPGDKSLLGLEDSTARQNQTGKGLILGTVNYMSPEQAKGEQVDARTDIFSLGVVIYEMITARTPFAGDSMSETFANLINQEAQPLSRFTAAVPDELERIVARMLSKNRDERYQTMKRLISALKDLKEKLITERNLEKSHHPAKRYQTGPATVITSQGQNQTFLTDWKLRFAFKQHWRKSVICLAAALIVSVLSLSFFRFSKSKNPGVPFRQVNLSRLTTIGNVDSFALSPDGNLIAYETKEKDGVSLWVRQLEMGNSINLVPLKKGEITFLTFSPDGKLVYYGLFSGYISTAELYSVPALGGASRKISDAAPNFMSFAPDGNHYAQVTSNLSAGEKVLVINSLDSNEQNRLAVRRTPSSFNISGQFCAWSPDGRTIAVISNDIGADGQYSTLVGVNVTDGLEKTLSAKRWNAVSSVQWLRDGSGLIVLGNDTPQVPSQIWFVSATDGDARKVTNDLNDYSHIGVTASGKQIVSVQESRTSGIWLGTVAQNSNDFKELISETGTLDTIVLTSDGNIVFRSNADGKPNLWAMDTNGNGRKQITVDAEIDGRGLSATFDGKEIVFPSRKAGRVNLWRVDANGGDARQLTFGDGEFYPNCMPGNRGVIYQKGFGYGIKSTLWKISLNGGEPVPLTDYYAIRPALSPDGRHIAFFYITNEKWSIGIISSDGGGIEKHMYVPDGVLERNLRWSPDGQSLFYIANEGNVGNVWSLSLNDESPRQVTRFSSHLLADFFPGQHGNRVVVTRTVKSRDVVILSDE